MNSQTLTGFIKKLLVPEGFGFIATNGFGDIFFHRSQCASFGSVAQGDFVFFEVEQTKKGKAAKNVKVAQMSKIQRLVQKFVFTKDSTPKHGHVVAQERVVTKLFSDPAKGRAHVESLAKEAGCNAVLGLSCHRESVQLAPNYFNTFHRFTANIAVLVEDVDVPDESANKLTVDAAREIETAKSTLATLTEARKKEALEAKGGNGVWWALLIIASVAMFQLL